MALGLIGIIALATVIGKPMDWAARQVEEAIFGAPETQQVASTTSVAEIKPGDTCVTPEQIRAAMTRALLEDAPAASGEGKGCRIPATVEVDGIQRLNTGRACG
jgi:hypothetical protein